MIGRMTGVLIGKNPPQITLDVQGIGYDIDVPMSTFYTLPASGERIALTGEPIYRDGNDILNALLALGYSEKEAQAGVKTLAPDASISDGIRQALKLLSKA